MKKILMVLMVIVPFVLGIIFSDVILKGINTIFSTELVTKAELEKKLEQSERKNEVYKKKIDGMKEKALKKQADLNNLAKEIESSVTTAKIKDLILTSPSSKMGPKGKIQLGPTATESVLKPTTTDDADIKALKNTINQKTQEILGVSRGILKEKIGQLNQELLRINDELKERNVELIANLRAVEKYKKELEEHKKYINDLEGIKSDLEKTVGVLETKIEDGRLKVSFKGDILFDSGKHRLRSEGEELLEKVYPILSKSIDKNDIFIGGHTDNVPIRDDAKDKYRSNWELSTYRAIEVVRYLVGKGLPPKNLTAAGYGEFKPIADNSSEAGKAKNRRVELFLIPRFIKRN
jgi:chemotaxis protein MotB